MGIDLGATLLTAAIAFAIRFDGIFPPEYVWPYLGALGPILLLRILLFKLFGLYRQVWSQASLPELLKIVWAVTADTVGSGLIIIASASGGFPRSVLIIAWLLNLAAVGAVRLWLRVRARRANRTTPVSGSPRSALVFGAGDAGAMLVREFSKHPELNCTVIGFIDDDRNKQGYHVAGKKILGNRADLAKLVEKHEITDLIIAVPSAGRGVVREIFEAGRKLGLNIKTVPGLFELVNGQVSVTQIRDIQIEDILGREEIKTDLEAIAGYLSGETVLVTGAGGSIGSELCRQIAAFNPTRLVLLGQGENSIYEIELELRGSFPGTEIHPVIADVKDEARVRQVFERFRPGVVFHAAAHKHVPLMELSPEEAIKNNVFGTWNVARAADGFKTKRFVLISSDKAVNPTSVMGATKRAAEFITQTMAAGSRTVFVAVRFGNVLGSRGSVVPLFKRQIAAGGPVTVTDPRMTRYFMTIPEAVQLVIQAASMGSGGEIFVLDMGKPVRILDLARDMIRLSGFEPDLEIPIVYTGIRDGEKLFEELLTAEEGTVATKHQRIFIARGNPVPVDQLEEMLAGLKEIAVAGTATAGRLHDIVGNFLPGDRLQSLIR